MSPLGEAFPNPPLVRKQVRFWERVFKNYPSTTLLIHDLRNPDLIVDIVDFSPKKLCANCRAKSSRRERELIATRFLDRYGRGLERFVRLREKARDFGAIEKRLYDVYSRDPSLLAQLYKGHIKLRIQTGLADEFTAAATTARAHFPAMERLFLEHGVPTAITRLPFVESMFNIKAQSKVGASGMWQFMPETARRFLHLNPIVDERKSPLKATRAAARLMVANYQELQSWPLAITAYNHGPHGLIKAVQVTGSRDIGAIIERYESPSFGFASRNFYAEFLAAYRTYEELDRQGRIQEPVPLAATEVVTLSQPMTVVEVLGRTGLPQALLAALNPCLLPQAFHASTTRPLPKGYQLHVPNNLVHRTQMLLESSPSTRYARR